MSEYKPPEEISQAEKIIKYHKDTKEDRSFALLEAKMQAIKTYLKREDAKPGESKFNYKKLLDPEIATKYRNSITDHLKKDYQQTFGVDLKDIEKRAPGYANQLLELTYGISDNILRDIQRQYKDKFTHAVFTNLVEESLDEIVQKQSQKALSPIKRDHLEDVVKYTKLDTSSINKDLIGHEDVARMLHQYITTDELSKTWLEKQHFYNHKKPETKDKPKEGGALEGSKKPIGLKKSSEGIGFKKS
jgi:hypothetical protein